MATPIQAESVEASSGKPYTVERGIPDDCRELFCFLARCTSLRPKLWSSEKTIIRFQVSLFQNGSLIEAFSEDIRQGGLQQWIPPKTDKKEFEDSPFEVVGFTLPMVCDICGNRFNNHPGYQAKEQDDNSPDYFGSLDHSTVALKSGKSLELVKAATDRGHLKESASIADFKKVTLPGWDDKRLLDRVFHTPICTDFSNRSIVVTVEVLDGPDLVSELTVEAI